jgi:hypothetical protein
MANPALPNISARLDYDNLSIDCEQIIVNGVPVVSAQQATIADIAAVAAYTAHASGAVAVTSNAATDLDTTAAALAALRIEVAALAVSYNGLLLKLENFGILADA